jgi:CubicO group peptidase (beta-lactamase class C family)
MKRFIIIFGFIALILFPIGAQERVPLSSVFPVLETYVDKAMAAEGIPGAVVVVVKDGKIVYLKGFGVRVLGQKEPVDGHTPFALASVTKSFTNALVARLVDQGKLKLQDKVTKYLPELRLNDQNTTQELTIEDLLSHQSGMPEYAADSLIELGWTNPEIVSSLKAIPLAGDLRKNYGYQNVMVGLMGNIFEKVTGKTLSELYREELFQPLGLNETTMGERTPPSFWQKLVGFFKKKDPQPTFHDRYLGKVRYLPNGNPLIYTLPASSGIISTGHDIGNWLIFLLNNGQVNGKSLISERNLNQMRVPRVNVPTRGGRQFPKDRVTKVDYGMGWFIHDYAGVPILSHMGGMAGTRSFILIIPQENLGVAILTNFGGMRVSLFPEAVRNKFLDLYLNVKDEVDWAKKAREEMQNYYDRSEQNRRVLMLQNLAPPRDLNDYTGVYENAFYGRVEISKKDDALLLSYRDRSVTKLSHWNGNIFQFQGSDLSSGFSGTDHGEVIFSQDRGKANKMIITLFHEGADSTFHRVG